MSLRIKAHRARNRLKGGALLLCVLYAEVRGLRGIQEDDAKHILIGFLSVHSVDKYACMHVCSDLNRVH